MLFYTSNNGDERFKFMRTNIRMNVLNQLSYKHPIYFKKHFTDLENANKKKNTNQL